jgi:hypothetical protein
MEVSEYLLMGIVGYVAYRIITSRAEEKESLSPGSVQARKSGVDRKKMRKIRSEQRAYGRSPPSRSQFTTDEDYQAALEDMSQTELIHIPSDPNPPNSNSYIHDPRKRIHVKAGALGINY